MLTGSSSVTRWPVMCWRHTVKVPMRLVPLQLGAAGITALSSAVASACSLRG